MGTKKKKKIHTNNNCQDMATAILDGENAEVGPHKFWTNYNFSVRHIPMHSLQTNNQCKNYNN